MSSPHSLNGLSKFIQSTAAGLNVEVEEGDYDGLVGVMIHLLAVKDRQASTDIMFEPLKGMVELLSSYTQETPEDVIQQLEVQYNTITHRTTFRAVDLYAMYCNCTVHAMYM